MTTEKLKGKVADGGATARQARARSLPCFVAPTTDQRHNTLRPALRPVGCWRIEDVRFDFDSSFLLPTGSEEFALLAETRPAGDGGDLMSVFGHADPSGEDDYNKTLSGRRAKAVYGVLVRDAEIWLELMDNDFGGDQWGIRSCQIMLTALGHDSGPADGIVGPLTEAGTRSFQRAEGLPESGSLDTATKRALALSYMDLLCVDGSGAPFQYSPADFLGRGNGVELKADVQGCSEFNPVLVFSESQAQRFSNPANFAERNARNITNRRVVVLMFPPDTNISPQRWPCPTANEGPAKCRAQFWKDADARRNPRGDAREHLRHDKTFACSFYDRLARDSPCEGVRKEIRLFLFDQDGQPLSGAPYRLTIGPEVREGTSKEGGVVVESNLLAGDACLIEWGNLPGPTLTEDDEDVNNPNKQHRGRNERGFTFQREVLLARDEDEQQDPQAEGEASKQLFNLGYIRAEEPEQRQAFADDYEAGTSVAVAHQLGVPEKQA